MGFTKECRRYAAELGERSTGRPGRVPGTYEKSARGLPSIVAYALITPEGRVAAELMVYREGMRNVARIPIPLHRPA